MKTPAQTETKSSSPWSGLGLRIAAAAVMIPVVLAITWFGDIWFTVLIALIGIGASYEWTRIAFGGSKAQLALHIIAVIIATFLSMRFSFLSALALIAFVWSASLLVAGGTRTQINFWTFLGIPYIALPMAAFAQLRQSPEHGLLAIFWIFAVVWLADTMAYAFGRTIGGPKLAPVVSPNKTWSGMLGAIVGGALGGTLVAWIGGLSGLVPLCILAGAFGAIGQVGDLYESAAKRRQGLKDSGSIIPGHGGILDRIDALLVVAIAALIIGVVRHGVGNPAHGLLIW